MHGWMLAPGWLKSDYNYAETLLTLAMHACKKTGLLLQIIRAWLNIIIKCVYSYNYYTGVASYIKRSTQLLYNIIISKMSRCLSPHPDGWDVKPEVPGDLTRQAFSSLLQILVSHKSGKKPIGFHK